MPSSVTKLEGPIFSSCKQLKTVEFQPNSKLDRIANSVFNSSSIEGITVPPSVDYVCFQSFGQCEELVSIEFLGDHLYLEYHCVTGSKKLSVISFPFANRVYIHTNECNENMRIFIQPNKSIEAYFKPQHYE